MIDKIRKAIYDLIMNTGNDSKVLSVAIGQYMSSLKKHFLIFDFECSVSSINVTITVRLNNVVEGESFTYHINQKDGRITLINKKDNITAFDRAMKGLQ